MSKETVGGGSENPKQVGIKTRRLDIGDNATQKTDGEISNEPPDGGCRAYIVVLASFCTNGLIFGIMNSYSVVYITLLKRLQAQNVDQAEVKASLCGVLTIGCTFAISPVAGILSNFFGLRTTAIVGGVIGTVGMILSSFAVNEVSVLCFTYGILYGLGGSLAYTPSLAILGHYFRKYLGIVNGVVTVGSSVFTVMFPPLMEFMIDTNGLKGMFLVLAVFAFGLVICGATFKPLVKKKKSENSEKRSCKELCRIIIGAELWKRKRYKLWAICLPIAMFGYFVPYVHIKKYIEDLNFVDINTNLPLQGLAITSALGRLIFGYLSDKRWINKIVLPQITYFIIGGLTMILAFARAFWIIVLIALGMGICEGGFISLIGPVAFELCGRESAAQGIGCVLGIAAYPMSFGPPLAALLYSFTKSYTLPFILSGLTPIIGASLMFLMHFQKLETHQTESI